MKRLLATAASLALALRVALAAEPAALHVYAFEDGAPVRDAEVRIDGIPRGRLSPDGAIHLDLPPGTRVLELRRDDAVVLQWKLELAEGEDAELIATLRPDGEPQVSFESTRDTAAAPAPAGPPGTLAGRILSSEDGEPVVGARLFVSGTPVDARTDARGEFSVQVPAGTYAISAVAADYGTVTIENVTVEPETTVRREIELTPTSMELPEFVVLEPYIEGSLAAFVEERRGSYAVADILGAEQMSRSGDSDAAAALKRVTGLTLVDGRYVYVRGLGERYSSVLLNGAQIPSPDPTRRVVPLDLFPTEVLEGVVIQKTFSPEMPGEFGGGTIELRTKRFPDRFFLKLSAGLGYVDGSTGEDGLRYDGGDEDWTGRDDGTRALPESLAEATADGTFLRPQSPLNPNGATPAQIERFGEELTTVFDVERESLGPNGSFAGSLGNSWRLGDDVRVGFLGSLRWVQNWDTQEERRQGFVASDAGLELQEFADVTETTRAIDGSAFLSGGMEIGADHRLKYTGMLLRQTEDEVKISEGVDDNQAVRFTEIDWIENALLSHQLGGEHTLASLHNLGLEWLYTRAKATREAPNRRRYRYDLVETDDGGTRYEYAQTADNLTIVFEDLADRSESLDLQATLPFALSESSSLKFYFGGTVLERERDSAIRRYGFQGGPRPGGPVPPDVFEFPSLEDILSDAHVDPNGFRLFEATRATDNYVAEQQLDAVFLTADLQLGDRWRGTVGARREENRQEVTTFSISSATAQPVVSSLDERDLLPSAALTYWIDDDSQIRAVYAETLSRPDFRELSPAPFTDPQQDAETFGNPDLQSTAIKNFDLRYEYYFSPTESFSAALFLKEFENPIELLRLAGSGVLLTLDNALEARNYGVELDLYKSLGMLETWEFGERFGLDDWLEWEHWFVSANYAWIESEVELDPESAASQTNTNRPLQGQSPYVINLQGGYKHPDGQRELTLLYNRFGERIAQVGIVGAPDIYEQPFDQLDFVWQESLGERWKMKLRLRNLLDPTVEFTQGDELTREFKRGREIAIQFEWQPD